MIREKFEALAKRIKDDARFEITTYAIGSAAGTAVPNDLLLGTAFDKVEIPNGLFENIAEINGFRLEWKLVDTKGIIPFEVGFEDDLFGRICLFDIDEIIGMNLTGEFKEVLDIANDAGPNPYFVIDFFHPDYAGCTLLEVSNDKLLENLAIHFRPDGFYSTAININQYLEILLFTAGMTGSLKGLMYTEGVENAQLKHYLPQLFPEKKLDDLWAIAKPPL